MSRKPQVNEINEFLEIASDFENPLELIRESLSNAYDANAEEVDIIIRSRSRGSDIIIEDDGEGMNEEELASFFDLGNSTKSDSIGYKGHGTKIYYKSDEIVVNTTKDGTSRHAVMESPWEKLNRKELPEYSVTEEPAPEHRQGTYIKISGFRSGQGFDPESLTYNKIHHYLRWKTIGGSTAHFFEDDPRQMDITVDLDSEIDDSRPELPTDNQLTFPPEQLEPDDSDFPAERMCKHYDPRELEVEFDGSTTTVEIVGMIGGKKTRNELPTYGKHSAQFGVWLAKDHIKIEQVNDVVPDDIEATHLFFIANCEDLELTANRGKIRNKSSDLYQALLDEIQHYIAKVCRDPWFKNYLDVRRQAKLQRKATSQRQSLEQRRERLTKHQQRQPENGAELALVLERSNRENGNQPIEIADFQPSAEQAESFIRRNGSLEAAATELTVEDFIEKERTLTNVEALVVWGWGDTDYLREQQRRGYLGGELEIDFDKNTIRHWRPSGDTDQADIIAVKERLDVEDPLSKLSQ